MNSNNSTQSHSFSRGLAWGAGLVAIAAAALYLLGGAGPLHVAVSTTSEKTAQKSQAAAPVSESSTSAADTTYSSSNYDTPVVSSDTPVDSHSSYDTYANDGSNCGNGLTAGPRTSCPFAERVRSAYAQYGAGIFRVYSPVTDKSYSMNCVGNSTIVCRGGNNASVYF